MNVKNKENNLVRLGDYIVVYDVKNTNSKNLPFCGINKDKTFMPTVADTNELDNSKYKIVKKDVFVFSGMQTGRDVCIRLALYDKDEPIIVSPAYTTFVVKDKSEILPEYLFIQFNRFEMDRYGSFLSDGSIRSNLDWGVFCDIQIPLPSIEVQRELVATYNGLKALAEQNEALIKPLTEACQAYIVDCKRKYPEVELGGYIEEVNEKNSEGKYNEVKGLSTLKKFREPNSRVDRNELRGYKIVYPNCFSYVPTTDTWKVFACALNNGSTFVVSPIYGVFRVCNNLLLSEFLNILFQPVEFDRYVRYNSWGSARENFNFSDLCNVKIPLPPIEVQQAIVNLYHCAEEAKNIANEAREKMKILCPALVQRAINK